MHRYKLEIIGAGTFSITTLSIKTLSITTFSITTLRIMIFSITINKMRHSALWHSVQIVVMLSVTNKHYMLTVVILYVNMLIVIAPNHNLTHKR